MLNALNWRSELNGGDEISMALTIDHFRITGSLQFIHRPVVTEASSF
jgi:hypothetical protein